MIRSRLWLAFVLACVCVAVTGCKTVPDEMIGACEGQAQIIEIQGQNSVDLVNTYEADLIAADALLSQERLDRLLATGTYDTPEKIKQLVMFFSQHKDQVRAESDARKAKFMASISANVKSGQTLNKATREYLDSLDDKRKNLEAVINALKPPAPGAGSGGSPASRPSL